MQLCNEHNHGTATRKVLTALTVGVSAFQPAPRAGQNGFVARLEDVNAPPVCSAATASPTSLWPPNGKLRPVTLRREEKRKMHWLALWATLAWLGGAPLHAQQVTTRIEFKNLPYPGLTVLTDEFRHLGIVFSDDDSGLDPRIPCRALAGQENIALSGGVDNLFRIEFVTEDPVTQVVVEFEDANLNPQLHTLYALDENLQILDSGSYQDQGGLTSFFTLQVSDPEGIAGIAACEQPYGAERLLAITYTTSSENQPPDCSAASANPSVIWPPNGRMVPVSIADVTDPDGDPVSVSITGITQDEPLTRRGIPDASGLRTATARLRASRAGGGDGRVYHLSFEARDQQGASCTGAVTVCVPHDQGKRTCGDGGPLFWSTGQQR